MNETGLVPGLRELMDKYSGFLMGGFCYVDQDNSGVYRTILLIAVPCLISICRAL